MTAVQFEKLRGAAYAYVYVNPRIPTDISHVAPWANIPYGRNRVCPFDPRLCQDISILYSLLCKHLSCVH